jgi:hypothetical protein
MPAAEPKAVNQLSKMGTANNDPDVGHSHWIPMLLIVVVVHPTFTTQKYP